MWIVSDMVEDGMGLPKRVVLHYVYGFSDEVILAEASPPFLSKFAWQKSTLLGGSTRESGYWVGLTSFVNCV